MQAEQSPAQKTDAASQTTKTDKKNVATTAKPPVASAATGPARPTTRSAAAQTDDLPVFSGMATIIEERESEVAAPEELTAQNTTPDTEEKHRWDRRTRQGVRAGAPPMIHDRAGRPELPERDPELLPEAQSDKDEEDHPYMFQYEDGSQPTHPVVRLYRDLARVRVVDLDLRRGTRAYKAARTGYYLDRINGNRLFLQK